MHTRLLSLAVLIALAAIPTAVSAASGATLTPDVQCWRSMGLKESPPPGTLLSLVQQCVQNMRFQAAATQNIAERELRRQALLERARMQARQLARVRRGVVPATNKLVPAPVPQRLPTDMQRGSAINLARQQLIRRRQWINLPEALRDAALLNDRDAARQCLTRTDVPIDDCVRLIAGLKTPRAAEPSEIPAEYVGQKQVTLSVNQSTVTGDGISIQLLRIVNDSRCLQGATCLWAGEAGISARIFSQEIVDAHDDLTLMVPKPLVIPRTELDALAPPATGNTVKVGRCTVAFARLLPYPTVESLHVDEEQYVATFVVIHPAGMSSCAQ